jgi:hypothetical protein
MPGPPTTGGIPLRNSALHVLRHTGERAGPASGRRAGTETVIAEIFLQLLDLLHRCEFLHDPGEDSTWNCGCASNILGKRLRPKLQLRVRLASSP